MPRYAAIKHNTEAVCLPNRIENKQQKQTQKTKATKTIRRKTKTNEYKKKLVYSKYSNDQEQQQDKEVSNQLIKTDKNLIAIKKSPPAAATSTTARTKIKATAAATRFQNIQNFVKQQTNEQHSLKKTPIFNVYDDDDDDDGFNDHDDNAGDCGDNVKVCSTLYPAVFELIDTSKIPNTKTVGIPATAATTTTTAEQKTLNAKVQIASALCTQLPAVIPIKKSEVKLKTQNSSNQADRNRLLSLRTRKNLPDKKSKPESPRKGKVQQIGNPKPAATVPVLPPPPLPRTQPLKAIDFERIEVLEYDEAKAGSGAFGGTKRKRNNSLTSGAFGSLTALAGAYSRKRTAAATAAAKLSGNNQNQQQIHAVEQKGGGVNINSSSSSSITITNMPLYEQRCYETASTAAATAGGADSGARFGGGNNGYLSSTRSSSASSGVMHASSTDNGIVSDAVVGGAMETQQYYLSGGNTTASNAAATLNNGSSGNSTNNSVTIAAATTNHAPSMATLCNIGNSCYLNSVVYTLRFAPRFLHNLHHLIVDFATVQQNYIRQRNQSASLGRGINASQLNSSARSWSSRDLATMDQYSTAAQSGSGNGLSGGNGGGGDICKSRHQLLTEKLHELYQSLHENEINKSTEPHHADPLLSAIQDVSSIFEGNQQQDAHEFLMCVLNSIRETCQSLIKMIAECPDLISEGNILQSDEVDANDREMNGVATTIAGTAATSSSTQQQQQTSSQSSSSSLSTKAWFTSRKSKRKDEAKSAKSFRLQSPLKDAAAAIVGNSNSNSNHQQAIANSQFYLNSVDLSGGGASASGSGSGATASASSTATTTTASSPTTTSLNPLTNSVSSDTSDSLLGTSQLPLAKQRLAEKIRELGLDFFSEDFEGITVATTKCLSCETITEQKESMIDIAVPVPISGYDSADYTEKPSAFIQNSCITREYFRGENKYRCEQCTGYTEAIRSISYEVLPRLLVIQLSRFSGGMEKINSYIPTSFTLQCFCSKCCELSDGNKLHVYKLYSVITHVGATMSVGHYIAYTCSLDMANEYTNCPKDRRATLQQQRQNQNQQPNGILKQQQQREQQPTIPSAASAAASAITSSGTSLMKKMKFGRNKASSSGDISKNIKNLNGMTNAAAAAAAAAAATSNSQAITNGISKLSMNTTCHSLSCCATRLSGVQHQQQQQQQYGLNDLSEESLQNGANHNAAAAGATSSSSITSTASSAASTTGGGNILSSYSSGYGSTGRGGIKSTPYAANANGSEPIWYMCDDDKIKAMTQREFEELLSPSRKITVTPYLLFYARFDLQPTISGRSGSGSSSGIGVGGSAASTQQLSNQTTPQSSSAMSWSSESLQTQGNSHKIV